MYILKVKGTARIPDYVQLRDDDFTLLAYFRVDRPEKAFAKVGLTAKEDELIKLINDMPYGKMQRLDI
ncbi:MAG TPA: fructose-6-phosphate aldolase [Bacteroidia bacterium]|nr:fructose-6-phosphate aldolase [Bacteroidia bacterium]HNS12679.1 fructose-6-phosphate aldolase [Bacteroidia bacterium]